MSDPIKRDDALEPCPFCRSQAKTQQVTEYLWEVWCFECTALMQGFSTEAEAIAAWNTRALPAIDPAAIPALQARIEELEAACWRMQEDRDRAIGWRDHNWTRADTAEAKLAKAVEALRWYDDRFTARKARDVLAELEAK